MKKISVVLIVLLLCACAGVFAACDFVFSDGNTGDDKSSETGTYTVENDNLSTQTEESSQIADKIYKLLGMDVKFDFTQGEGSNYANAQNGFHTSMTGFDLRECRVLVREDGLYLVYCSDYANPEDGLSIKLLFERVDGCEYFEYSGYRVNLGGEDIKDAEINDYAVKSALADAVQLDKVFSSGKSVAQLNSCEYNLSFYLSIEDESGAPAFFAEVFGVKAD